MYMVQSIQKTAVQHNVFEREGDIGWDNNTVWNFRESQCYRWPNSWSLPLNYSVMREGDRADAAVDINRSINFNNTCPGPCPSWI